MNDDNIIVRDLKTIWPIVRELFRVGAFFILMIGGTIAMTCLLITSSQLFRTLLVLCFVFWWGDRILKMKWMFNE